MKYLLRGGPMDGEFVDPPPSILGEVAEAIADEMGAERTPGGSYIRAQGWVYEFSADEADVLVGRPATEEELRLEEIWKLIAEEEAEIQAERERMRELSPHVLAALKHADRLLVNDRCVAATRGEVAIFIARGKTAEAWKDALGSLDPEHGCTPEEIPDSVWEAS